MKTEELYGVGLTLFVGGIVEAVIGVILWDAGVLSLSAITLAGAWTVLLKWQFRRIWDRLKLLEAKVGDD